jgi:hypothetical protein
VIAVPADFDRLYDERAGAAWPTTNSPTIAPATLSPTLHFVLLCLQWFNLLAWSHTLLSASTALSDTLLWTGYLLISRLRRRSRRMGRALLFASTRSTQRPEKEAEFHAKQYYDRQARVRQTDDPDRSRAGAAAHRDAGH